MAGVFSDYSKMLPPALTGVKTLASSSVRTCYRYPKPLPHAQLIDNLSCPQVAVSICTLEYCTALPSRQRVTRCAVCTALETHIDSLLLQLFLVPGLRHMWHWLGMRPVSRAVIEELLGAGTSVCLCPGGVQVCSGGRALTAHGLLSQGVVVRFACGPWCAHVWFACVWCRSAYTWSTVCSPPLWHAHSHSRAL